MNILSTILLILLCAITHGQVLEGIQLDALLDEFDENTHIEIGIFHDGNIETIAYVKDENGLQMVESHPDKMFEIGSITKVFTAFLTHQLISSNPDIHLHSKLKDLNLPFPVHTKNETRLLHLLNHTSNLPKMPVNYVEGMISHPKNP